jgi:hypothetical protein
MFLAAAISAGCYYCMWSGFGVNKKLDSAGNTRMVFFGHFVDRIFSMPLVLYSLCMVANAEMGEIVLLLGLDLLMVGCAAIGATQLHPWKWIWSPPSPTRTRVHALLHAKALLQSQSQGACMTAGRWEHPSGCLGGDAPLTMPASNRQQCKCVGGGWLPAPARVEHHLVLCPARTCCRWAKKRVQRRLCS